MRRDEVHTLMTQEKDTIKAMLMDTASGRAMKVSAA
jgi:hypothetical protein